MLHPDWQAALSVAHQRSLDFLGGLPDRPVRAASADYPGLLNALGGPMPESPMDAGDVIDALARAAEPGLVTTQSGRFFGFVIGGATPAALAADWLTAAWDQNAGLAAASPAAAAVEEVVREWLVDLLGLPQHASYGLVTGAQMANFTALAAARHRLLDGLGWSTSRPNWQATRVRRSSVRRPAVSTEEASIQSHRFAPSHIATEAGSTSMEHSDCGPRPALD